MDISTITIDGIVWVVEPETYDEVLLSGGKFRVDYAYVKGDKVYVYAGKEKDATEHLPGRFYKKKKGEYIFIPTEDPEEISASNVFNTTTIKEKICNKDSLKDIEEDMPDSSDLNIFAPPIKESDDQLKKIVKLALEALQLDLRLYRHEFKKEYDFTNLKASVTKEAPMTMKNFLRWVEVLDLDCIITVDSKCTKRINKLAEPIVMSIQ